MDMARAIDNALRILQDNAVLGVNRCMTLRFCMQDKSVLPKGIQAEIDTFKIMDMGKYVPEPIRAAAKQSRTSDRMDYLICIDVSSEPLSDAQVTEALAKTINFLIEPTDPLRQVVTVYAL